MYVANVTTNTYLVTKPCFGLCIWAGLAILLAPSATKNLGRKNSISATGAPRYSTCDIIGA